MKQIDLEMIIVFAVIAAIIATVIYLGTVPLMRYIIKKVVMDATEKLLTDKYTENLAEFLPSFKRFSVLHTIELALRAEEGKMITRPLGSPKHFLGFENLMFTPRQMTRMSIPVSQQVNMNVTLGRTAKRPLQLKIPLMISGMGYGLALSENAKIALVRAANALGTGLSSGEGPLLPEEVAEAERYVLQIARWSWGERTIAEIRSAEMLEVQMGQGADIGASVFPVVEMRGRAARIVSLSVGQEAISLPAPPGINKLEDWPDFMAQLREKADGIPIALKLMATDNIEADLDEAVRLGFDVVVIDGAQGGAHATPPIKQDDFGIPTLYALVRARQHLDQVKARGEKDISLVIGGGFFTPGQCLKALTLGADAVYLGTVPLFALVHNQLGKVFPWEPLTTLVFYDSPSSGMLDIDKAAKSVTNAIKSMVSEMEEAMRALGKTSLQELNSTDLVALDEITADLTGVHLAYQKRNCPAVNEPLFEDSLQAAEFPYMQELAQETGMTCNEIQGYLLRYHERQKKNSKES